MNVLDPAEFDLRKNVRLASYTSFGIGGPADYFVEVRTESQLKQVLKYANEKEIPFFLIGGGTNLLISDRGVRGLIVKNLIGGIRRKGNSFFVKSGEQLDNLVQQAARWGFSRLEFASGIPGTVGGAIYGNAGAFGKSIGDLVKTVRLFSRDGNEKRVDSDYLGFSYRHSNLKTTGEIVVEVELELEEGDPEKINNEIERIKKLRREKHPTGQWKCAGSFFKNLPPPEPGQKRVAAGLLLDQVGARGMKMGKAEVFPGHANFITNPGEATCEEIINLAQLLKKRVFEKFGVELEEEVIYVDEYLRGEWNYVLSCEIGDVSPEG